MDFEIKEIESLTGAKARVYSVILEGDEDTLLEQFFNENAHNLKDIKKIKEMVESNINNNKNILKMLDKSMLMMEFNQLYLTKFLTDGTLSKEDLLNFYQGGDMSKKYQLIEKDIEDTYA